MTLFESVTDWVAVTSDPEPCPECGADLESGYVRAPNEQAHWRGVEALVCADGCGYARRDGEPEP